MIELFADEYDDLEYLEKVQDIVNGVIHSLQPEEIYLTHIDGWFDWKWLGFSGKTEGAVGVWEKQLTLPPFHPHRVWWQGYYQRQETQNDYALETPSQRLHIYQESHNNFHRHISRLSASAVLIWYSCNTCENGPGSLMVYSSSKDHQDAWYLSLEKAKNHWRLKTRDISVEAISFLEEIGHRNKEPDSRNQWLLFNRLLIALKRNDMPTVESLLDKVKVTVTDEGHTLLMSAAARGNIEVMRMLLDRGADVNARTYQGVTALMRAAGNGHLEAIEVLLDHGAAIDEMTNKGNTAMAWATYNDHIDAIRLLLERGANVNAQDRGLPPLHFAVFKGWLDVVEVLLAAGANIMSKDDHGNTALALALMPQHKSVKHHEEILELLQRRFAEVIT